MHSGKTIERAPDYFVAGLLLTSSCSLPTFTTLTDAGSTAQSPDRVLAPDGATRSSFPDGAPATDAPPYVMDDAGGVVVVSGDLDFGATDCGATAAPRTVTVRNIGSAPFTVTAELTNGTSSAFAVTLSSGIVPAHGETTITVTPVPVPSTAAAPWSYTDTLTVHTSVSGDVPHLIPVSETAQGAILEFDTQGIPFGAVPVSSAQSFTFHVLNSGNVNAAVTLSLGSVGAGTPGSAFAVTQDTSSVPSGENLTASATFSPTTLGAQSSSVVLAPAQGVPLCGPLPSPVVLSGVGETGGFMVSDSALTFGPTACGTTAAARSITLTNTGNAPLTWSAVLGNVSPVRYTVLPQMTGALTAGGSTTLMIGAGPIPEESSVRSDFYADTLTFNTNVVGDEPHVVALHQTASGAILAFNPATIDFGDVPAGTTATGHFQVVNTGNADAHATLTSASSSFAVTPQATTAIGAGMDVTFTGTFMPGTNTTLTTGAFSMASIDPLCAPLPQPLPVSGTGTSGVVAFAPGALTFGNQTPSGFTACGTQASSQQIKFTNSGNQSYTIVPALELGAASPYELTMSPKSGTVQTGGTVTLKVTPRRIPQSSAVPGSYGDTLTVTTNAAGDTAPHIIPLTQSAYGVILTGAPSSIQFPPTIVGEQSAYSIGITNSGNAGATLAWTAISDPSFSFGQNALAPPGGVPTSLSAFFQPVAAQAYMATATFGVTAETILCQPIPTTHMSLSGTGTMGSTVTVTPQVDFNTVPCGTSGGSRAVTVKNNSTATIMWNATLPMGSRFSIGGPASGTLAAGASADITVSSNVIPVSTSTTTAANGFGSQLTVTTSATGDSPHVVAILETASGAILSFDPPMLNLPLAQEGSPISYQVVNTGNLAATVTLTLSNTGAASLTLDAPTAGTASNGIPLLGAVTEAMASLPSTDATVSLAAAAGTVLCQPAPAPMTIVAN
jgi:hypothetical protein